jgi:hypothetical protein
MGGRAAARGAGGAGRAEAAGGAGGAGVAGGAGGARRMGRRANCATSVRLRRLKSLWGCFSEVGTHKVGAGRSAAALAAATARHSGGIAQAGIVRRDAGRSSQTTAIARGPRRWGLGRHRQRSVPALLWKREKEEEFSPASGRIYRVGTAPRNSHRLRKANSRRGKARRGAAKREGAAPCAPGRCDHDGPKIAGATRPLAPTSQQRGNFPILGQSSTLELLRKPAVCFPSVAPHDTSQKSGRNETSKGSLPDGPDRHQ